MMRNGRVTVATGATLLCVGTALWVAPARALDKCTARIRPTDGTILVDAKSVTGTVLWGNSTGTATNAFANAATCITGSPLVAKNCTLGTGAVAIIPPPLCTLYLADGSGTCSAFIKQCTPGTRPLVELPSRFVDHGDGTVTDTQTGLMWEQKNDAVPRDSTNPEYWDNTYAWSANAPFADGTVFTDFLLRVNGVLCRASTCTGLAGDTDWRLPTIGELQTIVDQTAPGCGQSSSGNCINAVFGPTAAFYWSSSTNDPNTSDAWFVDFSEWFGVGIASYEGKANPGAVRAVRGGR